MPRLRKAFVRYLEGYRKTAVFAITSRCNCKCLMCDIHKSPAVDITLTDAKHVLNSLAQKHFLIVYLTGGEPTLHPHVEEIVSYADELGLVASMTTNGTAQKAKLKKLRDAGLYLMSVSVDHWDPEVCEKIRNHPEIHQKQTTTIKYLREIGLKTYALAYLNSILVEDGVEKLVTYVNQKLGVPIGFCYPTSCDANTYWLGGRDNSHRLLELRQAMRKILDIKRNGGKIVNLQCYLEDVVSFPSHNPNYYCRGGEDVVYIDWFGDVYPCFCKSQRLFNMLKETDLRFLKNIRCNECLVNCFREPSLLPHIHTSANLLAKELTHSLRTLNIYK